MNDLLLDDDLDLRLDNGDLALGDDLHQRAQLIVATSRGNWKQWPLVGIGAARLHDAPQTAELRREIDLQLSGDGIRVGGIRFAPDGIKIDL